MGKQADTAVTAIRVGKILKETEKAFQVEVEAAWPDGEPRPVNVWMPKSRSERRDDGFCWISLANDWLLNAKSREVNERVRCQVFLQVDGFDADGQRHAGLY